MVKNNLWKKGFVFSIAFHVVLVSFIGIIFASGYQHQMPKEQFYDVALDLQTGGGGGGGGGQNEQTVAPVRQQAVEPQVATGQITNNDVLSLAEHAPTQKTNEKIPATGEPTASKDGGGIGTGSGGGQGGGQGEGTGSGQGSGSGSGSGSGHGSGTGSGTGSRQGPGDGNAKADVIERFVRSVERNKGSYPYMALKQNRQGVCYIYVKLDESGSLASSYIATSSGDKNLDEASLKAIQKTCPFLHELGEHLAMTVPVRWTIN